MTTAEKELATGKLLREEQEARKRRAYVDAQLSDAASCFRKAATQIELLLQNNRDCVSSALSKIDMKQILAALAEREVLQRKISSVTAGLQRLRSQDAED